MPKSTEPMVSVVIPTFNRKDRVGRAIGSVLAQTHPLLEVIVVDDASTDETAAVVASHQDGRITYCRHTENRGPAAARNTGMLQARGAYIGFLDSDDEWLPEKLEEQLAAYASSPLDDCAAVTCAVEIYESDVRLGTIGGRHRGAVFEAALGFSGVETAAGSSLLVHRRVIDGGFRFDERLRALEDRDFVMQVTERFSVESVQRPLVRVHRSVTQRHVSRNFRNLLQAHRQMMEKWLPELRRRPRIHAQNHLRAMDYALLLGSPRDTRASALAAARVARYTRYTLRWAVLSHLSQHLLRICWRRSSRARTFTPSHVPGA